jgi:hypothetical protein
MPRKKKTTTGSKTKKVKTIRLEVTPQELVHIRDLMSIALPPDGERTVSSCLALITRRQVKEGILWKKIVAACKGNDIPIGDFAPDFHLDLCAPVIDVFAINSEDELEDVALG